MTTFDEDTECTDCGVTNRELEEADCDPLFECDHSAEPLCEGCSYSGLCFICHEDDGDDEARSTE